MTRTKLFLIVQAVLCAVIAVLLAAGALGLYLDGAAKQAEGDLFCYIFTRERAGAKLLPVLPLLFCALGLTAAGVILGIKDENAEKPVRDEKLLRDPGSIRERAVHQQADQKTRIRNRRSANEKKPAGLPGASRSRRWCSRWPGLISLNRRQTGQPPRPRL